MWNKISIEFYPTTGASNTILCNIFSIIKFKDITRYPKYWITDLELLRAVTKKIKRQYLWHGNDDLHLIKITRIVQEHHRNQPLVFPTEQTPPSQHGAWARLTSSATPYRLQPTGMISIQQGVGWGGYNEWRWQVQVSGGRRPGQAIGGALASLPRAKKATRQETKN